MARLSGMSKEEMAEILVALRDEKKKEVWDAYKDAVINGVGMTKDGKYVVAKYEFCKDESYSLEE